MKQAGFTLIEVLVALLIFSLAIIGLTAAGTESVRAVAAIDSKMLAGVVADNQLVLASTQPIQTGEKRGSEIQMSREFTFEVETTQTETADFFQQVVRVKALGNEQILAERTSFRTRVR